MGCSLGSLWRSESERSSKRSADAKAHEPLVISSPSVVALDQIQVSSLWQPGFWVAAPVKERSTTGTLPVLLVVLSITISALSGFRLLSLCSRLLVGSLTSWCLLDEELCNKHLLLHKLVSFYSLVSRYQYFDFSSSRLQLRKML